MLCGAESNETWAESSLILPWIRSVSEDITSAGGQTDFFDTTLGVFGDGPSPTLVDDDSSPLGNGLASAVFNVPLVGTDRIRLRVSGFSDFTFDGIAFEDQPHQQTGSYDLFVDVYDSTGALIEEFAESDALTPGEVDLF